MASALGEADREVAAAGARTERFGDGAAFRLQLVAHDPEVFARFYGVVANPVLWFVQHGLWDLKHDPDADLEQPWSHGYVAANRALAAAAVEALDLRPDAAVFVHDYHLYLVPALVRQARPAARIAHFVHIPWVGPTAGRCCPARSPAPSTRVCSRATASASTPSAGARRSSRAARRSWRAVTRPRSGRTPTRSRSTRASSSRSPGARPSGQRRQELLEQRPEILVLRVDRIDPSKNAVRGFAAFERLLELEPVLHGRIQLVALLDPSRQEIPEYVDYRHATEAAAAAVNDRFGMPDWQPVRLDVRDDFPASVAAFLEYDVLLVNPVMDGLNLVAKEAPLVNERHGVVVLSRQAGAYEELGEWVLGVDPLDVEEQAEAMRTALGLGLDERERRGAAIRGRVRTHDLDAWAERELDELDRRTTPVVREA